MLEIQEHSKKGFCLLQFVACLDVLLSHMVIHYWRLTLRRFVCKYFALTSDEATQKMIKCTEQAACLQRPHSEFKFSYDSWTKKYGLYCEKEHMRENGKTLFFVCNCISSFGILMMLDLIGRKNTSTLCAGIIIVCSGIATVVDSWYWKMASLGLTLGCEGCFSNLFNLLMNESSRKKFHDFKCLKQN